MRKRGLLPVDFSRYPNGDTTDMQWVVIWAASQGETPETRFLPVVTLSDYRQQEAKWPEAGFSISRFDIWMGLDGEPSCSVIWTQTGSIVSDTFADWRYTHAFGDLSPGTLQSDFRFEWIPSQQRDQLGVFKHLSKAQEVAKTTASAKERDPKSFTIVKYYSLMGEYGKAREILVDLYQRWKNSSLTYERFGIMDARMGNREKSSNAIDKYASFKESNPAVISYLKLRAAVLAEDGQAMTEHLQKLEQFALDSSKAKELLARAYATLVPLEEATDKKTSESANQSRNCEN